MVGGRDLVKFEEIRKDLAPQQPLEDLATNPQITKIGRLERQGWIV